MFRSSLVIFTATLAFIFLKKKLYRHHVASIIMIIIGIIMGGLSQILKSGGNISVIGVVLVLVAQLFGSAGYVIEEKYLDDFDDLDPQFFTGI
jgi:drug/metabolite transporter (DMT)-like permease